ILSVAQETGVRVEGIAFSREILRSRPIWFHSEANPRIRLLTQSSASICLRDNHNLRTVGEAEDLSLFLDDPNHSSSRRNLACSCYICEAMSENIGCSNPNECLIRAKELLDTLPKKWDPRFMIPEDYKEGPNPQDEGYEFDRRITTHGTIADAFRIFTEGETCNELPDLRIAPRGEEVQSATEGFCLENNNEDARAGAGICVVRGNGPKSPLRVPQNLQQTKQNGEALAAKV
ncbi:hypothetical protein IW262DRAFT_1238206, partial [Armillaria fumosa]